MHEYVYVNMHCRSSSKTARGKCNREETDSSRRGGVEVCVGRAERSSRSYRGALSVSDHCTMFCIFWARCVIPCICSASPHLTCLVLEIVGCFWNSLQGERGPAVLSRRSIRGHHSLNSSARELFSCLWLVWMSLLGCDCSLCGMFEGAAVPWGSSRTACSLQRLLHALLRCVGCNSNVLLWLMVCLATCLRPVTQDDDRSKTTYILIP